MTTYTFIYDYKDSRFKVKIKNAPNPDKIVTLNLNIEAALNTGKAISRTVYDIMKDAAEDPRVLNIKERIDRGEEKTYSFEEVQEMFGLQP